MKRRPHCPDDTAIVEAIAAICDEFEQYGWRRVGPSQLWVADITFVTILAGFVYVAVILDAWSRRVVGYAISRSIDARLTLAALAAAIQRRKPPASCFHHSDRG